MKVIKRTGQIVNFDASKIKNAVSKALVSTNEVSSELLNRKAASVSRKVIEKMISLDPKKPIHIETIQDLAQKALMEMKYYNSATAFIIHRYVHAQKRTKIVDSSLADLVKENAKYFDHDFLRQFVYLRTYAKWLPEKNRREVWTETVERYIQFMINYLQDKIDNATVEKLRKAILKQDIMPSMRLLQFAGPAAEKCNVCVYNCAYTAPQNFKHLADIMYILMSGTGIGFSVEKENVEKFPSISKFPSGAKHNYLIGDSREGWADGFQFGLERWYAGDEVNFDYSSIRPVGSRLKTMGGRASGPDPLRELMIFSHETINKARGRKLTPLELHDIICKIGQVVVSGGTRRSSLISLSDLDDHEIRDCKSGQFWLKSPHRSLSNNSAVYNKMPSSIDFLSEWTALAKSGTGERGIFNRGGLKHLLPQRRLELLGEARAATLGGNPCLEILLQPQQFCNLTEVICRPNDTEETLLEKMELATILGTYQTCLTDFKYIDPIWKQNQDEEKLLGVSLSGQWDCQTVRVAETLKKLRDKSVEVNTVWAEKFGIRQSTATTTVKPSGTVSQLVGSASGIHPRYAPFYIRRVRISATDSLFKLMKDQGYPYHPEVGQPVETANTYVLEFPCKSPTYSTHTDDLSAIDLLNYVKRVRKYYTEHSTSVTINVRPHEWLDVGKWAWDHWNYITGLSFFPHNEHAYELAPYEEITEDVYHKMMSVLPEIDTSKIIYYETEDGTDLKKEVACAGGACEL